MLKHFFRLVFIALWITQVRAQTTVTFSPSGDAFVLSETADVNINYGSDGRLLVSRWTNGPAYSTRSYLKFDVSTIPSTVTVCSAILTVYTTSDNNPAGNTRNNAAYLKRVTATWSQSTITWSNQPAFSATDTIPFGPITGTVVGTSYTVNVTSQVQNMVSTPSGNYGWVIALKNETNTYAGMGLASSENTVVAHPLLTITYAPSITGTTPASRCGPGTVTLGATANAGTINWYAASTGGSSLGTGTSFTTPSISATTTYYVDATYNACTTPSRTAVVATVNTLPTLTISPASATLCAGQSSTLTASGASTYTWSPPAGLGATTGPTVVATPTSSVIYTASGTNASGCVNTKTVSVTINALPTLTISPPSATLCAGQSSTLTASGASTYTWSPPAGLGATTGFTVVATPTSSTIYTVTGTSTGSCVNTATVSVAVNSLPTVTVSASSLTVCTGSGVTSTLTASGANTYTWSPPAGLSATTGSVVVANPTVATTYTVVGTSTGSCTSTRTISIAVNAPPALTLTPVTTTICTGSTTTLSASGATTYSWSPATGLGATTGATVAAHPTSSTIYSVTGTTGGCTNTKTVSVAVNTPTMIGFANPTTICFGGSTTLYTSGAVSCVWTPTAGLSSSSGTMVTASPTVSTTYTPTLTNAFGCVNTGIASITVNALPTISVSASSSTICAGSGSTLTASGASTYSWLPVTGLSATTGSVVTASPSVSTIYTVTGTNSSGCVNTKTVSVTANALPALTLTPSSATLCAGKSITLTASGANTYAWSPTTGLSAVTGSTVSAGPVSGIVYTVTGTSSLSCVSTKTINVVVNPSPSANAGPDQTIIVGYSVSIGGSPTATGGTSPYTYSWTPVSGVISSTAIANPAVQPTMTMVYTVTVTDNDNCQATDNVTVYVSTAVTCAVMKEAVSNNYYLAQNNTLFFALDGEYSNSTNTNLNYTVYDYKRTAVLSGTSSITPVNFKNGDNRYRLDVTSLSAGSYYMLEVTNQKNQKYYLRFVK